MKVAVVHNFHAPAVPSGENVVVHAEVAALRRGGFEVGVAAVENDEFGRSPIALARGAFTTATGIGPSPVDLLDGFRADVIHVHNLFPWFGRHWASKTQTPIVTTQHNYRPSCANGYLFRDGVVCTLCPDGKRWSGVRYGCYRGTRIGTVPLAIAGRRGAGADAVLRAARRVIVL